MAALTQLGSCSPNLRMFLTQARRRRHYYLLLSMQSHNLCLHLSVHLLVLWGIQQLLLGELFFCASVSLVGFSLINDLLVTSFARDIILTYFAYGVLLSLGLQLTYTAAFMAVVATFKDSKW